jgi:hypothetical protein
MRATERHRRGIAFYAALLWLLAVEVMPALHLASHDDDHTHSIDGTIISHRHDDQERKKRSDRLAIDEVPHAAAGIAHHATALHQPPPPITSPVAVPHAETWRFEAPHDRIASAAVARPSARGPPVA